MIKTSNCALTVDGIKGQIWGAFYSRCTHISAERNDPVTGEIKHCFCDLERTLGKCGKDGLFFEEANHVKINKTISNKIINKIFMLLGIR